MTHLSNLVNFQRPRGRSRRLLLLFSMVEELLLLEPLCTTTTDCVYLACFWPFVWPFRFLLLFTFGTIFLFFDSFLCHVVVPSQWHRPKVFRRNFMILVTHCRVILTSARACEYFLPSQLVSIVGTPYGLQEKQYITSLVGQQQQQSGSRLKFDAIL